MLELLPSERMRIRSYLSAQAAQMDYVGCHLPIEIIILISDQLHLSDIFISRMVSKTWLSSFTQSDVIDFLARKHFRLSFEDAAFQNANLQGL